MYQRLLSMMLASTLLPAALAAPAFAGTRNSFPVVVDALHRRAQGALGTARNSVDTKQLIGCRVDQNGTTRCLARDAGNVSLACTSTAAGIRDAAQSIGPDSLVIFEFNDAGICTSLQVSYSSELEPKKVQVLP